MPLDIQAFRLAVADGGNLTLQGGAQDGQLVRGGAGTWLKSLFNIGEARADNIATLAALRDAIAHDPRYTQVLDQAQALLGRLDTDRPLEARAIRQVLDHLDTAAANQHATLVEQNTTMTYSLAMRELNEQAIDLRLRTACLIEDGDISQIPAKLRSQFIKLMGTRITEMAGDFTNPPDPQAIRDMITNGACELAAMCKDIANSSLPPATKSILQGMIFKQDGQLNTREALHNTVVMRESRAANETLFKQLGNLDDPQCPLRARLDEALHQAGITEKPTPTCLEGLRELLEKKLGRTAEPVVGGPVARLTEEQGNQALDGVVADFMESWQAAATLPNPADAGYMKQAVLESPTLIPAAYISVLSTHAGDIPPQALAALGDLQKPREMLEALEGLQRTLADGFENLPKTLRLEGNLGHQSFMTHVIGLTLARAGLSPQMLTALTEALHGQAATALRQALLYASSSSPQLTSTLTVLTTVHGALSNLSGVPVDDFVQRAQIPIPDSADQLPVDARALLPRFAMHTGAQIVATHAPGTEAQVKANALGGLLDNVQRTVLLEMRRHITSAAGGTTEPTFEKDLYRGQSIILDGRPLPTEFAQLPVQVQDDINQRCPVADSLERTAAIKQAIVRQGYEAFTRFLFGPDHTFDQLDPAQQRQLFALTSLSSQGLLNPAKDASIRMLSPDSVFLPGSPNVPSVKDIMLTHTPSGGIALRLDARLPIGAAAVNGDTHIANPQRSRQDFVFSTTIPAGELERMAGDTLDWGSLTTMPHGDFNDSIFKAPQLDPTLRLRMEQPDMTTSLRVTLAE